jgi:hypothetical protein
MATASDVYSGAVESLPPSEQLRLASLILQGLAQTSAPALDYSEEWSEEDLRDVVNYAVRNHAAFLSGYAPEDEGLYDDYSAG